MEWDLGRRLVPEYDVVCFCTFSYNVFIGSSLGNLA